MKSDYIYAAVTDAKTAAYIFKYAVMLISGFSIQYVCICGPNKNVITVGDQYLIPVFSAAIV